MATLNQKTEFFIKYPGQDGVIGIGFTFYLKKLHTYTKYMKQWFTDNEQCAVLLTTLHKSTETKESEA